MNIFGHQWKYDPGDRSDCNDRFEFFMRSKHKDPNWNSNLDQKLINKEYQKFCDDYQRVVDQGPQPKPKGHVLPPLAGETPSRPPARRKRRKK